MPPQPIPESGCPEPVGNALDRAAAVIASADALLIAAGAGMGVDSGLPDFRGPQGFWRAYPAYEALGLDFPSLANPRWFRTDPALAWGFYGHRLNLYRATEPHAGFAMLDAWMRAKRSGGFVFTSNVDGHFERAGFDPLRIVEVHGTVHAVQCTKECGLGIMPADDVRIDVDLVTFRARLPLPSCPSCGAPARPNVLMFDDAEWDGSRTEEQWGRLSRWLHSLDGARLAIVELGAGRAVPTVRNFCEHAAATTGGTLIRINPREAEVPRGHVAIASGALDAIRGLDARLTA